MSTSNKRKLWKPCFEYKVDYNDHFETPLCAYEDILPLLDLLNQNRKQHVIYDPYYCNGRVAVLLRQLGFDRTIHAKRDFYKDVEGNEVPEHDTLVTNPPYSENHKEKCIEFCIQQFQEEGRAFFLLMPNYVAAKSYFRTLLNDKGCMDDVAYVVPAIPYEYDHPEGTGHEIPPFNSLWFVGIGKQKIRLMQGTWNQQTGGAKFVTSLNELEKLSVISMQKRPNPKQRKKRRLQLQDVKVPVTKPNKQQKDSSSGTQPTTPNNSKKKSRYRDGKGKRTKKRF
ncbi:unnamed protein product [Cylindrotheca closterium]|uniref:Uncharacterized protein n=1 Tax=Cylindrotheca closterium TaxID=2856 RepID=A0AAD2GBZ2_9STRA|nr:unnamed protein product [Cylindrotheca closterium]